MRSFSKCVVALVALCLVMSTGSPTAALPPIDAFRATQPVGDPEEPMTRLIYVVPNCAGCQLFLFGYDSEGNGWGTPAIDVNDGRAEVTVETSLTKGLVTLVETPWERHIDGTPTMAIRYNRQAAGSRVVVRQAQRRTRASGCWAGTSVHRHRFHLVVRRVSLSDRVVSTLAFARRTQPWAEPMTSAPHGRLRTFVAEPCRLPGDGKDPPSGRSATAARRLTSLE